jgi:hypothetical protein
MTVQASEVRELIEQVRGDYGYDVETGERVDLEYGIPEHYEPILSRMEAGGEMTFDEEWRFVEAYSFFCRKHDRSNEVQRLLKEAEVRLVQSERIQAYWDGEADGWCYIILPEAVEQFMAKNPKAVRIIPDTDEPSISKPDEKRLAAAMEWTLHFQRKIVLGHMEKHPEDNWWHHTPDDFWIEWKTLTGKRLVKRFEIAD